MKTEVLEKVGFAERDGFTYDGFKPPEEAEALTKREYHEVGTNNSTGGYGANAFGGQTFAPLVSHTITKVGIYGWKQNSPSGDGYIDLYNCDQVTHLPIGSRLARATYATGDVWTSPEWIEKVLDNPTALSSGVEYALIFSQPSSDVTNNVILKSEPPVSTYARGVMLWTNSGFVNLAVYSTYDYQFREYSGT